MVSRSVGRLRGAEAGLSQAEGARCRQRLFFRVAQTLQSASSQSKTQRKTRDCHAVETPRPSKVLGTHFTLKTNTRTVAHVFLDVPQMSENTL